MVKKFFNSTHKNRSLLRLFEPIISKCLQKYPNIHNSETQQEIIRLITLLIQYGV